MKLELKKIVKPFEKIRNLTFKEKVDICVLVCLAFFIMTTIVNGVRIVKYDKKIADISEKLNKTVEEYDKLSHKYDKTCVKLSELYEKYDVVVVKNKELVKENKELKEKIKKNQEKDNKKSNIPPQANLSKKTYMDYRCISSNSKQGQLQKQAITSSNGVRKIGDYYCVAMGSFYGGVGDKFIIKTDKGNTFKVVMGDIKSDADTDISHRFTVHNGCALEFIVDTSKLDSKVRTMGSLNCLPEFSGNIIYIERIK